MKRRKVYSNTTLMGGRREGAGRPSKYNAEVARKIIEALVNGETLAGIADKYEWAPSRVQMWEWLNKHPEFLAQYQSAREFRAESTEQEIQKIYNQLVDAKKKLGAAKVAALSQAFRIAAWKAARENPRRYGEQFKYEQNTINQTNVKIDVNMTPEEAAARWRERLRIVGK